MKKITIIVIIIIAASITGCDVIKTIFGGLEDLDVDENTLNVDSNSPLANGQMPRIVSCNIWFPNPCAQLRRENFDGTTDYNYTSFNYTASGQNETYSDGFGRDYVSEMVILENETGDSLAFVTSFNGYYTGTTIFILELSDDYLYASVQCDMTRNELGGLTEWQQFEIEGIPYNMYYHASNYDEFYLEGSSVCDALGYNSYTKYWSDFNEFLNLYTCDCQTPVEVTITLDY